MQAEITKTRSDWIRSCLGQSDFRGNKVITQLSPPDVAIHALDLPMLALPDGSRSTSGDVREGAEINLSSMVDFEIKRLSASDSEKLETDFWSLPKGTERSPTAIGVAVASGAVATVTRSCQQAKLNCLAVDAGPCAIVRMASTLVTPGDDQIWGVLDLSARQSRLVICVGHIPVLVRTVGDGGQSWTQQIAEELNISPASAEIHKCDHGFSQTGRGSRRADQALGHSDVSLRASGAISEILFGIMRSTLSKLVSELEKSYSFVLSCYPASKPGDLVLVGGGALARKLPDYLSEALGITAARASDYLGKKGCALLGLGIKAGVPHRMETGATKDGRTEAGATETGSTEADGKIERYATAIGLAMEVKRL